MVTDPSRYRWSSCRHYFSSQGRPDWLAWEEVVCEHGRTVRQARRSYGEYLAAGVAVPPESALKDVVGGAVLGSPGFVEKVREWVTDRVLRDEEVPQARELRRRCSVEEVETVVAKAYGVAPSELRRRRRGPGNEGRRVAIYLSRVLAGVGVRELGNHFGGVGSAAISNVVRGVSERRTGSWRFRRKLAELEKKLCANR